MACFVQDKTIAVYYKHAKVAKLVDALALGARGATRESSSLSFRTLTA